MEQTWQMAAAAFVAALAMGTPAMAHDHKHDHSHDHAHHHSEAEKSVHDGYFEDAQVQARPLSDWQGDWQSVYPYLADGTLDPVMAHKAEHGDKTAEEYRAYYETGYKTDVDRIAIDGDSVTFHRGDQAATGRYASDGHEILTYAKGNRGVRFIFKKVEGDEAAPDFIQFSDHRIAPEASDHFHLYWGDDRAALLDEVTNWPTYYPASLDADGIVAEMLAH
ncbi:Metal-binding protein ZinT precursor [Paracoccus haematequi]|uniref:Metal-binding protein ZinT n=2 Tax=Paracoccus haematequi TaxID=2491866 RepID=A0A447IKI7_9RHOB|nr:metal-binding protein ZinT [Paracoccus haematequi]VDS08043.1 Metal-binding protein ZinT precursor [Paracoccus haematequi]